MNIAQFIIPAKLKIQLARQKILDSRYCSDDNEWHLFCQEGISNDY